MVESIEEGPDGAKVARIGLSDAGKGLVAAVTPVLMAEVVKNFKFKPGAMPSLPPGVDLSNLSQALPALLNMTPGANLNIAGLKVPKAIVAIFAPFLQGFLGQVKPGTPQEKKGVYLEEPIRR